MFLGWNEIKFNKLRYGLIVGVMSLVAYLVFFLTGLSYGLAQDNRSAIDMWQAEGVLLAEDANGLLTLSRIDDATVQSLENESIAPIMQLSLVAFYGETQLTVNGLGVKPDSFVVPEVSAGTAEIKDNEVIVDESLNTVYGIQLGDTIEVTSAKYPLKVVGFVKEAKLSVQPVVYMTADQHHQIRYGDQATKVPHTHNLLVVKSPLKESVPEGLIYFDISTFVDGLPGYKAQVLTFGFMIGFLIAIAAIVVGIFMYVLTLQKVSIFGVMKAQGISSGYISKSVVGQTFLLATVAVGLGLGLVYLTVFFLPEKVPFQHLVAFEGAVGGLMIACALIGAIFSLGTIRKIDPLQALNG